MPRVLTWACCVSFLGECAVHGSAPIDSGAAPLREERATCSASPTFATVPQLAKSAVFRRRRASATAGSRCAGRPRGGHRHGGRPCGGGRRRRLLAHQRAPDPGRGRAAGPDRRHQLVRLRDQQQRRARPLVPRLQEHDRPDEDARLQHHPAAVQRRHLQVLDRPQQHRLQQRQERRPAGPRLPPDHGQAGRVRRSGSASRSSWTGIGRTGPDSRRSGTPRRCPSRRGSPT